MTLWKRVGCQRKSHFQEIDSREDHLRAQPGFVKPMD